ncbi:venom carboxylesterase-6-like, partial [Drosophila innubila]|uniref:venom carboxylesterase-6-like n=1 Tax=Drosophila innubila TaxID=198719 RepID=UPI00148BD550
MSASPYGTSMLKTDDMDLAQRQARLLKCPERSVNDLVTCLREKPMMDYVTSYNGMFEFGWNPVLNWSPVVERDHGQERFLIEDPYKTAQSGNFYKVPVISGITEFEFLSGAFYDLRNNTIRNMLNSNWDHVAPIAFLYERDTPHSKEASAELRKEYLGSGS